MEIQLTSLERKIDDLLATVASLDEPGSEVDEASTETMGNFPRTGKDQSEKR
ncbi:MAG: hypothetical protein ALECFALPRED_003892 [Alectoria fallacina]|uniref:Uncharacterized protein n=1 Tax=Alectoria fallacina TaxID=1903189 RepID=A0A8H3FUX0_9LECA|nr:MAG: hypothetical protein ALECFALPRED_003892 [Alectoria fallacina]